MEILGDEKQEGDGHDAADGKEVSMSAAACVRTRTTHTWLEANNLIEIGQEGEARVGLVYDEAMLQHGGPPGHPERPLRLQEILRQLGASGLLEACTRVEARDATEEELLRVHADFHVEKVLHHDANSQRRKPKAYSFPFGPDTYVNQHTAECAKLAAGGLLSLIDACLSGKGVGSAVIPHCGMAVVRPPGHHASAERASGFCLFNNVAVAARHLQQKHGLKRVAIVDWDVHHGNGTSDIFTEDESVLFFSMHRYETNGFFPGTGFLEDVGHDPARGYTVNVPLDKGYGDQDVAYIVRHVLCPLLDRFKPEAILVSSGFDAVRGDPLGECRVTPEGFGWLTRCLHRLAKHYCEGRLYLALEGGYNCDMIAQCTVEVVQSLLAEETGLTVPRAELPPPSPSVAASSRPGSMPGTPSAPGTPATPGALGAPATPLRTFVLPPALHETSLSSPRQQITPASPSPSCPSSPYFMPGSPCFSASAARPKAKQPNPKTVKLVRKITEMHNMFALELPLAPKPSEKAGVTGGNKSSRKNDRRRLHSHSVKGDEDGSTDNSGWDIAIGSASDAEPLPSPSMRPMSRATSGSGPGTPHSSPPALELLPSMPHLSLEGGTRGYPAEAVPYTLGGSAAPDGESPFQSVFASLTAPGPPPAITGAATSSSNATSSATASGHKKKGKKK